MNQTNLWQIDCDHTPETLDRLITPIRKRGLSVSSLFYVKNVDCSATCYLQFENTEEDSKRVYNNMLRLHDVKQIIIK